MAGSFLNQTKQHLTRVGGGVGGWAVVVPKAQDTVICGFESGTFLTLIVQYYSLVQKPAQLCPSFVFYAVQTGNCGFFETIRP